MHYDKRSKALGNDSENTEDTVYFEIYPDEAGATAESIEILRQQCLQAVEPYLRGYIWQRDGFNLEVKPQLKSHKQPGASSSELPTCLQGQATYGDNVEDEWLITWLLLELTRRFQISARAWDSDGEFLLIEAAYALPKWLKPETAAERVWLRGGALHVIPTPSAHQPTLPASPITVQALQILQSPVETLSPSRMQAAIAARLSEYPQQILKNIHHASAILPADLASVLQQEPQLVAPAVEAFHYRDPDSLRAARSMRHFPAKDMVETVVAFSRCLYAQLAMQAFQAPRGWPMPLPSESEFAAAQLGAKVAAGFEMLLAKAPAPDQGTAATELREVESSPAWQAFVSSLADKGFFGGEPAGSEAHRQLMLRAARQFRGTDTFARHMAAVHRPVYRVFDLLRDGHSFDPSQVTAKAESDAWLSEGAEEIERQLKQRQQEMGEGANGADDMQLAARFKDFFGGEAGVEGADVSSSEGRNAGGGEGPVSLDEQEIWREMKRVLQLQEQHGLMDDATSEEGSSFYGEASSEDEEGEAHNTSPRHVQPPSKWTAASGGGQSAAAASRPTRRAFDRRATFDDRTSSSPSMSTAHPDEHPAQASSPQQLRDGSSNRHSMSTRNVGRAAQFEASERVRKDSSEGHSMSTRKRPAAEAEHERWETATATDSDDEPAYFDEAYNEALKAELRDANVGDLAGQPPTAEGQRGDEDVAPVDVDMNLVQNLLASYDAQQGLAGPVGNLAGMLGLQLPGRGRHQTQDELDDLLAG